MSIHVFGIRHHGPGSSRSLRAALAALRPDAILIEGPPDAEALIPLVLRAQMQPPVALLIYAPDEPKRGAYYPFAVFSPEWQALHFGLANHIPVQFIDLPQAHQLVMRADLPKREAGESPAIQQDPLHWLAEAAGYSDGERWWEHMIEQRRAHQSESEASADVFAGILEAMTALRAESPPDRDPMEAPREAHMRRAIRAAQKQGREKIAVVCGAWHTPALTEAALEANAAKADNEVLKGLPKIKVTATWVPWTYGRLTFASGYGAGIESPGWYHHLWETEQEVTIRWLTKVAHLLRDEDLDASPAQIIDAVRLAETLAALRERPIPGLPELNEAVQSVLCFGGTAPMRLIWNKLIVSDRLGEVPDDTPMVPLQQDVQREQKRLKLKPDTEPKEKKLDLRDETDRERSYLLHRLSLLDIDWGEQGLTTGREQGSFWEYWTLQWQPDYMVDLIEASQWGNTLYEAVTAYAKDAAAKISDLPTLTSWLREVLMAALPEATETLIGCLREKAALTSDVLHLMVALPPLAQIARYGDVRQTDKVVVESVLEGLISRIGIGLPVACASLDDDAAATMYEQINAAHGAIIRLDQEAFRRTWEGALRQIAEKPGLHGLVAGRCCRLLSDSGVFASEEAARRFGLALSLASDPAQAAAWIEGFLGGSGQVLLFDDGLWGMVDHWLSGLHPDVFTALLPLVRRTFATFSSPERAQMGQRVRRGASSDFAPTRFNAERAARVLPLLGQLLGHRATN